MARTLSATLLSAQNGTQRKPYIRVVINSVDYSARVLFVEHHEEAYRDYATIILSNADRGLDSVATASSNLLGYRFRIGYGLTTGAGDEYSEVADLWVKSQQMISRPGELLCVLYCEGQWSYLREQRVMATLGAGNFAVVDPNDVKVTGANDPFFSAVFERTKTVYELIESVLESAFGWTLNAFAGVQDGIINSFKPYFSIEELPYAASVLNDLIQMTKCYLRPKANLVWDIVFPQDADAVNETFYSYQAPYFKEYAEKINLVVPNRIIVFANNPDNVEGWPDLVVGDTGAYVGNYTEVIEAHIAWYILTEDDADKRANAILTRYKAEQLAGYLVVPHDSRIELYDKVSVEDTRGA